MTDRPFLCLPETLTDGIVLLDSHRLEDAEAHLAAEDEEMRRRFDAARPATLEQTRNAMARWIEGRAAGGSVFAYAVRRPDGLLIGGCELRMRSATTISASYWIFPRFRRLGHATRALALLLDAAAGIGGLRRVEMRIAPDNGASLRLAEKAGFSEAGEVEHIAWTGMRSTMILFTRQSGRPAEEH
jgi:[ribosomal protein S5]-alanine N-acetyltransferase